MKTADIKDTIKEQLKIEANFFQNYDVPTQQCEMRTLSILQVLIKILGSVVNVKKTPKDMFKYILENALIQFSPVDMFMTSKPKAATIINSTPYKIG